MMKKTILAVIAGLVVSVEVAMACTSAIVGASAAKNGRPLLWKHRDTGTEHNFIARTPAQNGEYAHVALYNGGDSTLRDAWMGMNEAGFAIMNTASYNLAPDTTDFIDQEGAIMKLALRKCKTLTDFETLLDTVAKPMGVQANFGVIDATGAGAYYETDDYEYVKFSLTDTDDDIIVRTNYSYTGENVDGGYGYIREENAKCQLAPYIAGDTITPMTFTEGLSRTFYHSLIGRDFGKSGDRWIIDQDFIPRRSSSASIVVEGVRLGENPRLMIMWTAIGYPPCSYVVPVMVDDVPHELQPQGEEWRSELCDSIVAKKHDVFSITRGSGKYYIDLPKVLKYSEEGHLKSMENYNEGYKKREKLAKKLK